MPRRRATCKYPPELATNGMSPMVWGPMMWRWMHGAAYANDHSQTDPRICARWLLTLQPVLPCKACRTSFKGLIANGSVTSAAQARTLGQLVFSVHNAVNQ